MKASVRIKDGSWIIMNQLPINTRTTNVNDVIKWREENNIKGYMIYSHRIYLEHDEDAAAFVLKFGL